MFNEFILNKWKFILLFYALVIVFANHSQSSNFAQLFVTAQKINFFIEDFFIFCTVCSMGSLAVEDCLLRSDFYKIY